MMSVPLRRPLWALLLPISGGLIVGASAIGQQQPIAVGQRAPALQCQSVDGRNLEWKDFDGRVVILFFHSQDMAYSKRGLEAVVAALAAAEDLRPRASLMVVTNGQRDVEWLQQELELAKLPGLVVVDPDRSAFPSYRIVAFPTVCCISPDRTVVQITKGFGPLLATKTTAGARLAAGLLDEAGFAAAVSRNDVTPETGDLLRVARSVRMAEQLFHGGMIAEARRTLEQVLRPDSTSRDGLALMVRVLLAQGLLDEAGIWLGRLQAVASDAPELRELRAERALLTGDAEAALRELAGVDDRTMRVAWIKGRALEHLKRFREAAEVYRRAIGAAMERDR